MAITSPKGLLMSIGRQLARLGSVDRVGNVIPVQGDGRTVRVYMRDGAIYDVTVTAYREPIR